MYALRCVLSRWKAQTRTREGTFHKDLCFSSVKLNLPVSPVLSVGEDRLLPEQSRKFHFSGLLFEGASLPSVEYRNNASPFFLLETHVTRLKQKIAVTDIQLFTF